MNLSAQLTTASMLKPVVLLSANHYKKYNNETIKIFKFCGINIHRTIRNLSLTNTKKEEPTMRTQTLLITFLILFINAAQISSKAYAYYIRDRPDLHSSDNATGNGNPGLKLQEDEFQMDSHTHRRFLAGSSRNLGYGSLQQNRPNNGGGSICGQEYSRPCAGYYGCVPHTN